ncbi:hypothetical protein [Planomonospora venezuelensis]|uniref:Uncharacterized protein n=1 Tax=Planomonospora venezuelensis TaxID=1999 RepID=A0A841DEL0_PLAVE|nr:hypothetical protein [Planomonospora venezuelensis]MBB5966738.1 hypothetical protein [Planomonospora venezuelensis]GIN01759.1 hypothetical protein Pve01_34170 [Planomonospora venezuelensis]
MAPPRKPSRATMITAGVAIGVFGAGAGLGAVMSANSRAAQTETVRLAAGTYVLNAGTEAWTTAAQRDDAPPSGSGDGGPAAASKDTRVCLSLTTGGQAVNAGGSDCLALPSIGGALTALIPGNPSSDPVRPSKKSSDPPKKSSDPPKPTASTPPKQPPAQPDPVQPPPVQPSTTKKSTPAPDPKLTKKATNELEGSDVTLKQPIKTIDTRPSGGASPSPGPARTGATGQPSPPVAAGKPSPSATAGKPSPSATAGKSTPPGSSGNRPRANTGRSATPAPPATAPSATSSPTRTPSNGRVAPPSVETLRPALPSRGARGPAASPDMRPPDQDGTRTSPDMRPPDQDGTQTSPPLRTSGPERLETRGTDVEPPAAPPPSESSSSGDSVRGDPSLPVFQDPELLRRAYEALGLDRNMRYTDANGVWDLNIAPPGTPPCRNYTADELRALRSAQDGTALPEGVIPRDSCQWPAFIRWLFADPAPGEVSNWTKFTGLPERDLELVVTDSPTVRPSSAPSGHQRPDSGSPGSRQPDPYQVDPYQVDPYLPDSGPVAPARNGPAQPDPGRNGPAQPDPGEFPPDSGEYTGP